jgi:hypothetical protein
MVLPQPTPTPVEHEPTQDVAHSEPAAEHADAMAMSTFPATISHVAEPQQATPALGSR